MKAPTSSADNSQQKGHGAPDSFAEFLHQDDKNQDSKSQQKILHRPIRTAAGTAGQILDSRRRQTDTDQCNEVPTTTGGNSIRILSRKKERMKISTPDTIMAPNRVGRP